jgi:predicted GNAT family acetyltransferase
LRIVAAVAELRIVDNPKQERYEARIGRRVLGFSTYRRVGDRIVFIHTETDPEAKGRGIATHLAAGALDDVRTRDLKVTPKCPFIAAYIKRHPAYQDLVVNMEELRQRRSAG